MKISLGKQWKQIGPNASVGILIMRDVTNPDANPELQRRKTEIEKELRQKYAGMDRSDLRTLPTLAAYDRFYRQFRKTYHLQLQLESILDGKQIPSVASLVEAMFMAELEDQLLTAGHDLDFVQTPVNIDVASGTETYTRMNGKEQSLKSGDLYIHDAEGILSSVIYGPDHRTRIRPETQSVMFTTYAVPGILYAQLDAHLEKLRDYVLLISDEAKVDTLEIFS
jgi:DNA/RNA-binding domain of Phe-tRNA-synthetase-like protein